MVLNVCVHHLSICRFPFFVVYIFEPKRVYRKKEKFANIVFLFADVKKKKKRKMRYKLDARQVPLYKINTDEIVMRIRLRILSSESKFNLSQLESLLRSESPVSVHKNYCYDNNNSNMSLSYDSCFSPKSPINISITNHIIHPHLCQQDVSNTTVFISGSRQQAHCDNNKALIQSESKNWDDVRSATSKISTLKSHIKYRQIQPIIIDKNESNNDQTMIRSVIDDEKNDNINKNASSLSLLSSPCGKENHILATSSSPHSSSLSVLSGKPICVNNNEDNNNLSINNNDSSSSSSCSHKRKNLETNHSKSRRSKKRTNKKKNRNKRRKN